MPAVLAVTIYLLSVPVTGKKITRYLLWPVIWLISGALTSFLTYGLFIKLSHYVIPFYNPDMHYDFFRFKLWPNEAFALGLILGITLLSIPVIALVSAVGLKRVRGVHWIRSFILLGILGIFFVGSTIISMHAGGGFDLHNYDTFVLILFVIGSYWGMGAVGFDKSEAGLSKPLLDKRFVLLGLLFVPVFFALKSIPARTNRPEQEARNAIQQVQSFVLETDTNKVPILFIDYHHLLVYRTISSESIYFPYEKIDLMEMAMANNGPYLAQFWRDVQKQRFSLIISEVMVDSKQDINSPFGYENNVWSENLSYPILKYYQPVYVNRIVGLAIYAPNYTAPK